MAFHNLSVTAGSSQFHSCRKLKQLKQRQENL
jgi:hypothetical protein